MQVTVVCPAEGDRKLVAYLHAERSRLCKAQVMRIRGLPSADKAGLSRDKFQMFFIADALGLSERKS